MGIMLTQYSELFGALVCQNPLLDMRRFHVLLAGASWTAEFGKPDEPADWEFIKEYSPYHNISAERDYPPVLITTSTNDDRVHPGHARKMAAALEAAGHQVLYYENTEGGHAGAADNSQAAFQSALIFRFRLDTSFPHNGSEHPENWCPSRSRVSRSSADSDHFGER
jgi:prolyl oligopeptidase